MPTPRKIGHQLAISTRLVDPKALALNPDNERDYRADDPRNVSLRQSLASEGVVTPLHIYEDGVVDDGNRRLFNIGLLMEAGEWTHGDVPAIIVARPANEVEAVLTRLNKNEAAQFSPMEQARAFAKLRAAGLNNTEIARRTPFTSMHVGNMLTLHDASGAVRAAVQKGQVSATLAVETVRKPGGEDVLMRAIALAMSQGRDRATPRHVEAVLAADAAEAAEPAQEAEAETDAPEAEAEESTATVEGEVESEVEAEVEADATAEAEAEADDPPFDIEAEAAPKPTPAVVPKPAPAVASSAAPERVNGAAPEHVNGGMSPKALLSLIAPTIQTLADVVLNGTKGERLEALDEAADDLAAFVTQARAMGLLDS